MGNDQILWKLKEYKLYETRKKERHERTMKQCINGLKNIVYRILQVNIILILRNIEKEN
jgi:hypothetical protein